MQLTFGGVAGFCSGYAVKKVGRVAALVGGLAFIGVQLARYQGFSPEPNWEAVNSGFVRALDADGDGKITINDVKSHADKVISILGFNVPGGAAFGAAFLVGLRCA